ncbi:hypothetical protein GUG62_22440 [Xanthomonas citri pv. citri]|nr:hypothetical protein [Xanthomonas citri pv. citri]
MQHHHITVLPDDVHTAVSRAAFDLQLDDAFACRFQLFVLQCRHQTHLHHLQAPQELVADGLGESCQLFQLRLTYDDLPDLAGWITAAVAVVHVFDLGVVYVVTL